MTNAQEYAYAMSLAGTSDRATGSVPEYGIAVWLVTLPESEADERGRYVIVKALETGSVRFTTYEHRDDADAHFEVERDELVSILEGWPEFATW